MGGSGIVNKPPQTGLVDMGDITFYNEPSVTSPPFTIDDLQNADGTAIFGDSFSEIVLNVTWAELQPLAGGAIDTSAIDNAISLVCTYNCKNNADLGIKLRVWGGFTAPDWAKSIDGSPLIVTGPGTVDPRITISETIGRFWSADYIAAWTSFQNQLAALYDNKPLIRGISNTAGATATDEPFVPLKPVEIAQLVAAGYTDAAQQMVLRSAIADYTSWSTTPLDYTMNQFLQVDTGTVTPDPNFTLAVLQLAISSSRVVQAGNHALNNPLYKYDAFVYAQLAAYAALIPETPPGSYQTASPINLGATTNWGSAVSQGVMANAGNIELWDGPGTTGFTGQLPPFVQNLATILAAGNHAQLSVPASTGGEIIPRITGPLGLSASGTTTTYTWSGGGNNPLFADGANWTPLGGPPGTADSVIFNASPVPIAITGAATVNALVVDAIVTPGGGSTLSVDQGGVDIANQTGNIGELVIGGVDASFVVVGNLDIGGGTTNAGGFGSLLATLAPDAYSTARLSIGGTLQVWENGVARVSGDLGAAAVIVRQGGTISGDGTISAAANSSIVNDGVIEAIADQTLGLQQLTLNSSITGAGRLVIDPAATLILTGSVDAQQTITFAANSIAQFANDPYTPSTLVLEPPLASPGSISNLEFFGTIDGFTFADSLVLQGVSASAVTYDSTSSTLTIFTQSGSQDIALSGQIDMALVTSVTVSGSSASTTVTFVAPGLGQKPNVTAPAVLQAETGVAVTVPDIVLQTPLPAVPINNTTILVTITAGTGSLNASDNSGNTTITILNDAHTLILAGTLGSVERSLQSLTYASTVPGSDTITLTVSDYDGMSAATTIAVNTGTVPAAFVWTTPSDGVFSDAANWTTSGSAAAAPPGGADFAIFNSDTSSISPYTVSGDGAVGRIVIADSLTLTGQVLAQGEGDQALIVNGSAGAALTLAGGAVLTAEQSAIVGASGHGILTLMGGALDLTGTGTAAAALVIGNQSGSNGTVLDYQQITALGTVIVGAAGDGTIRLLGAASTLSDGGADIGQSLGATGVAVIDGGFWSNAGTLTVGDAGIGSLLVGGAANGITGQITANNAVVAAQKGSSGSITLAGGDLLIADATAPFSTLVVGAGGAGTLTIDGGNVTVGAPLVTQGSTIYNGTLTLGDTASGSGFVSISNGGKLLVEGSAVIGSNGAGHVTVGETGSDIALLAVTGSLTIGASGQIVLDGLGATLRASAVTVAAKGNLSGAGTISGDGGGNSTIALTSIDNAGTITATGGNLLLYGSVTDTGLMAIGTSAVIALQAAVGAGQTLSFGPGAHAVLDDAMGFAGTISGFAAGNVLDLASTAATSATWSGGILTISTSSGPITLNAVGHYAPDAFIVQSDNFGGTEVELACFAAGTRILTPNGPVAVEDLVPGDCLVSITDERRRIEWIGRRHVDCRRHPSPRAVWPIRIKAGAFATDCPARDLFLSPDHAVYTDGVLIPVKYLLNGMTLRQMRMECVTYFHLELPTHDVVLAEGLAAESFLDTGNRDAFANATGPVRLHPEFAAVRSMMFWEAAGYAPLHVTGPIVQEVRARLAVRAKQWRSNAVHRTRDRSRPRHLYQAAK